jgi:CHRD domain
MVTKSLTNRNTNTLALLSIVVVLLLVGCGTSTTAASSSTPASAPTRSSTTASATLKHVPTGTADLRWNPSTDTLTVKLSLTGLAPNSTHPSHIHAGSCNAEGKIVYPLRNVVADVYGNGTATSTVPHVTTGIPAKGWSIEVHNGPGLAPADQSLPLVCADVTNANTSTTAIQSVRVALNTAPPASTGESAQGTAQLTLSGRTLTVKLTMSGLAPNIPHPAHIHSGSCAKQGPVIYPLTNVVADASGNARVTTTIKNVSSIPSSGWIVNVHYGPGLSNQTEYDPIACGDVMVK